MRLKDWQRLSFLLLLALLICGWADFASASVSACSQDSLLPQGHSRVFYDASGDMRPKQIMQLPAGAYYPIASGHYLGNSKGVWWQRLTVHNKGDFACKRWLVATPSRVSDVRVYLLGDTGWERMVAGAAHPFHEWALPERQPVFPIQLSPGETTVLVQVVSNGQTLALAPRLWAPNQFLHNLNAQSLSDGLAGGSILLLVLISLVLSYLYRRPPLLYMALATGLYAVHVAMLRNYLFVYFWPDSPMLNHWARLFVMGLHFVAFFAYLYTVVRIDRLGRWIAGVFYAALVAFTLLAVFGGLLHNGSIYSYSIIGLYQGFIWLLVLVVGFNQITGRDRHWFAPVLIGAICLRGIVLFGQVVGLEVHFWGAEYLSAPMMLILGVFLFGTLFSQARKGRLAELRARAALDVQRATENDRLERTVQQRTSELAHALQARRQLLGRISHDLRSPLAGMLDAVRQWRAGDDRRDYPRLIERHAHQQMDMVDELLAFSRTETAEIEPEPIPGYLYAFLQEVAEQAELAAEQRGNRLRRDFADNLPALVNLDFHYLQRVLVNLLGNASKFTQRGYIYFAVESTEVATDEQVRLHFIVDDTGPGIAANERQRLRRPFARGDQATGQDGYGLGLSVVSQLLEWMGSELEIDEAPAGGSRFHFELEVEQAAESDLEPVLEEGGMTDFDGAGRCVVVVDDDDQQCELLCDLLNGYGFDGVAAASGNEALALLQGRVVDLVLTDQFMENGHGWRLLGAIRERRPGLPVILYSSVPARPPVGVGQYLRFDDILLKPADAETLLRTIDHLTAGNTTVDAMPGRSSVMPRLI